jgi:F-type H+-transporting ATPase subunit a
MAFRRVKFLLVAAFSLLLLTFSNVSFANQTPEIEPVHGDSAQKNHSEDFNVTETILEHIKDDHSWHLWGHTSVALPVILYTDKGLETFSSSNLVDEHHNPVAYNGKHYTYKLAEGKIEIVNADGTINEEASHQVVDFSITKNVAAMFISVALLLLIFLSVAAAYKKRGVTSAPKGLQSFMEPIILFVRDDIARPNIGHKYAKFMPFLLTIFFFIWINNMLGLIPIIPGGANLSGNIAFTMTLAVFTFFVVNLNGNKSYWGHIFWMPGVSVPIKIFLMPIEVIGVFTKPISLMIRLFANITAGHILVLSLVCLIFIFKSMAASAVAIPFTVFISCIELLVAFLQAFIFTMLAALYIGMATEEHGHHDEAHHH